MAQGSFTKPQVVMKFVNALVESEFAKLPLAQAKRQADSAWLRRRDDKLFVKDVIEKAMSRKERERESPLVDSFVTPIPHGAARQASAGAQPQQPRASVSTTSGESLGPADVTLKSALGGQQSRHEGQAVFEFLVRKVGLPSAAKDSLSSLRRCLCQNHL